jgi:hypothetical protein
MRNRLRMQPHTQSRELRVLEAPPGFEPGMEVLQSHPRFIRAPFRSPGFSGKCRGRNRIVTAWCVSPAVAILSLYEPDVPGCGHNPGHTFRIEFCGVSMGRRRSAEDWARIVEQNFVSCPECEPWPEGELRFIDGMAADFRDLVYGVGVPEDLVDDVMAATRCPQCRNSLDGWDEVGTEWPFETQHREGIELAKRRWQRKLDHFAAFLAATPMLGAMHPVGKRILKDIGQFERADLDGGIWYRARRDEGRVFGADELGVIDPTKYQVPLGRWNHPGQAHWYLAGHPDGALVEVLHSGETTAWVQEWRIPPMAGVLDLLSFGADDPITETKASVGTLPLVAIAMIFGGYFERPADGNWKPEYFVPLFVMDAAKHAGFTGVRCESAKRGGTNLVLFDPKAPLTANGKPEKMQLHDPARDPFILATMNAADRDKLLEF